MLLQTLLSTLQDGSQPGSNLPPRRYLEKSVNISGCQQLREVHLVSRNQRCYSTSYNAQERTYNKKLSDPNINTAGIEKLRSRAVLSNEIDVSHISNSKLFNSHMKTKGKEMGN